MAEIKRPMRKLTRDLTNIILKDAKDPTERARIEAVLDQAKAPPGTLEERTIWMLQNSKTVRATQNILDNVQTNGD